MTQTLGVNAQNDIYIGANGLLVMLQGQSAVQAACKSTSLVRLGEEVLSINGGLPFFEAVFNGVPNLPLFENYLLNALLVVPGVQSVKSITTGLEKRNGITVLTYTAIIENQFGLQFQFSGSISP